MANERLMKRAEMALNRSVCMLMWAVVFLIIAIIAGLFGFTKVESVAAQIAKVLFFIFIILFLISLVFGLFFASAPVVVISPVSS